jgi:predicted nucleic acid-binding protein
MLDDSLLYAVIDTNIVFEGLTKRGGASGLIIDAWLAGLFRACVSNSLAYEYIAVLSRKLSKARWQKVKPVLGTLIAQAEFVTVHYSWRPISPDPGDDHVIDCAMNAGAPVITSNVRDFYLAAESLGLRIMTPVEFVTYLANQANTE